MIDHIETLIKKFASQGKDKNEIMTELIHQGYDPDGIESAMNAIYARGELEQSFWNGVGKYGQAGESSGASISAKKNKTNIVAWICGIVVLVGAAYGGWTWYAHQPSVVANRTFDAILSAQSFTFSVEMGELRAQGIAIIGEKPELLVRIEPGGEMNMPSLEIIKKSENKILFKTGETHELSQYGWIISDQELFFKSADQFGLSKIVQHIGALRDFSSSRGTLFKNTIEKILHSAQEKSPRGILLQADPVYKRQMLELVLGPDDTDLLQKMSVAQWHLTEVQKGKEYTVFIAYQDALLRIGNMNMFSDIPFDSVTNPLESVLQWQMQTR